MLQAYLTLGLKPGASPDAIRKQYLERIKRHPPEKDPDRFQEITTAYEQIKDETAAIRHRLFGPKAVKDTEAGLKQWVGAAKPERRRATFSELLASARITRK